MNDSKSLPNYIIILFFLLFVLPKLFNGDEVQKAVEKVDPYVLATYESYIAYIANEGPRNDSIVPDVNRPDNTVVADCECKGTKQVRTGDGRVFPCPCGASCKCTRIQSEAPSSLPPVEQDLKKKDSVSASTVAIKVLDGIEQISQTGTVCVVFTDPSWCSPCRLLRDKTFPEMARVGYKVVNGLQAGNHICLLDDEHPLYEKYNDMEKVPSFVIFKNGVLVEKFHGYISSVDLADRINAVVNQ